MNVIKGDRIRVRKLSETGVVLEVNGHHATVKLESIDYPVVLNEDEIEYFPVDKECITEREP